MDIELPNSPKDDHMEDSPVLRLLKLPPELRDIIYGHLLDPALLLRPIPSTPDYDQYDFSTYLSLRLTSRQISNESRRIFHSLNHFVRVSTPWAEAQHHVHHEGHVPMVCTHSHAESFTKWEAQVMIEAPNLINTYGRGRVFVIQARDIVAFARMWYESELSHPGLSSHLRLTITVRENQFKTQEGEKEGIKNGMNKALQEMVISPFGRVKGLHDVRVQGEHDETLANAIKKEMAVPYATAEECLEQATKVKKEGDTALEKRLYNEAIKLYCQSFEHLHIRCNGRKRHVYGDAWFVKTLESGLYKGQQGHLVRLVIRVQLVAAVVECYLQLEEYEEAYFWGIRSINLMRQANGDEDGEGEDDPILGFPGTDSVGLIYFRTAKACRKLKDKDQAARLCKVALAYLPTDEDVRHEWEGLKMIRVGGYGWI